MKTLKIFWGMILDFVYYVFPIHVIRPHTYRYAFIVHPRTKKDIFRKIPFLSVLPRSVMRFFELYWFPTHVAPITGLKTESGEHISGFVLSIPMTAQMMLEQRDDALRQIRKALVSAKHRGAKIVGLGGLTSSLTHGGLKLLDIPGLAITTGHAYTVFNVFSTAEACIVRSGVAKNHVEVAVVGAAGSVGTMTSQLLVRDGVTHITLIDIERKLDAVHRLRDTLLQLNRNVRIAVTSDVSVLRKMHVIITATNAPDALIKDEHVVSGTIIIDDAQPSDVSDEIFDRKDVLVLAAGAVSTPGIHTHFHVGLHGQDVNYCCLAEVLALASEKRVDHFVIDRATLSHIDEIAVIGKRLSFAISPFQNEQHGHISDTHVSHVFRLVKDRANS